MASSIYLVKGVYPAHNEMNVALNAKIVVQFAEAMDPASLNPGTVRLKQINGPTVSCAYVYTPASSDSKEKVLYLTPDNPFTPGIQYQVEIVGGSTGIKSIIGTTLQQTKVYDFTAKNIVLPKAPSGLTLKVEGQRIFASWDSVEGATTYGVKLSTSNDPAQAGLSPAIGETTISSTNIAFQDVLSEGLYYVHVVGNGDVRSPWATAQVYVEAPVVIKPDPVATTFNLRIVGKFPEENAFEQKPEQIGIAFDQPVVRDERLSKIVLKERGVSILSGKKAKVDLTLLPEDPDSPEIVVLSFDDALVSGQMYDVVIPKEIEGLDGKKLGVTTTWSFRTAYDHFYGEISGVRAEIGELGDKIPDHDIASLMGKYSRQFFELHKTYRSYDDVLYKDGYPYYIGKLVELETALVILTTTVLNYSVNSDRTISLADLDIGERSRQVFGTNELLNLIRAKKKPFEDLMHGYAERGYASMDFAVRGETGNPYPDFIGTRSEYKELGE